MCKDFYNIADMDKDGKVDGIEIIKYISHMRGKLNLLRLFQLF